MNKRIILGAPLIFLLALVLLIAGCDSSDDSTPQAESSAPAEETAPVETATESAAEAVAVHDCAGGCGMKAVPESQMTEVDGKWYCAGCAKKVPAEGEQEGPGEG